jgi:hypothetical protein
MLSGASGSPPQAFHLRDGRVSIEIRKIFIHMFAPAARGQTSPATVDEVLNHANGRPKPLSARHPSAPSRGDLRCRSSKRARRRMCRIGLDGSDPAMSRTFFRHDIDSCGPIRQTVPATFGQAVVALGFVSPDQQVY